MTENKPFGITLPRWFPDIDFNVRVFPIFFIRNSWVHSPYNHCWFVICQFEIGFIEWKGAPLWHFGFCLYRKEMR